MKNKLLCKFTAFFFLQIALCIFMGLFKVEGDFREEYIGFSGEARFLLHSLSYGIKIS